MMNNKKNFTFRKPLFISLIAISSFAMNAYANNETDPSTNVKSASTSSTNTNHVFCDYKNNTFNSSESVKANSTVEWSCVNNTRQVKGNGLPDHITGAFPNSGNPHEITSQEVNENFTLNPKKTEKITQMGGPRGTIGYILNGIKIDAGTAGNCSDNGKKCSMGRERYGQWRIEALGQTSFNFGTDDNNAHVQPSGTYHYHGMPEGFIKKQGGDSSKMTMIGWATDGFPIYARYGHSVSNDASSALKNLTGSYKHVTTIDDSRASVNVYPLGTFEQDWEYVTGSGDLDECNGHFGVTPEFPQGIYHYYATDSYPFFQRCLKGEVTAKERRAPHENRPKRDHKNPSPQ